MRKRNSHRQSLLPSPYFGNKIFFKNSLERKFLECLIFKYLMFEYTFWSKYEGIEIYISGFPCYVLRLLFLLTFDSFGLV